MIREENKQEKTGATEELRSRFLRLLCLLRFLPLEKISDAALFAPAFVNNAPLSRYKKPMNNGPGFGRHRQCMEADRRRIEPLLSRANVNPS
jgi:hypothetical protein